MYVRRVMWANLADDLAYLRRRTVWFDLGVILATVFASRSSGSAP